MNPNTLQFGCRILIAVGVIMSALGGVGFYYYGQKAKEYISPEEKEKLTPQTDIKLFPFPSVAATPYKYPFKQYVLMIQNLNKNSVPITDFRIEFIFKNTINGIKQMPLVDSGGDISVSGIRYYGEKKDGTTSSYEEQPTETAITRNYSLTIQKTMINEQETNTNIAIFNCERWPEGTGFAGDIIVNLLEKPKIFKKSDKVGTYSGKYYYKIKGQKFSERIKGTIPDVDTKNESYEAGANKESWAQRLTKIDPTKGTLIYTTRDERWLERNNYLVNFIPHTKKDNFEIHVYRDSDNVFKVLISTAYSKKTVLKYLDIDALKANPSHPKHIIEISWEKDGEKLYIDGNLVDSHVKE